MASENGPGLVDLLRSRVMAPLRESYMRERMSQAQTIQANAILERFEQTVRRVRDEDRDAGWIPVGGGNGKQVLTEHDRQELREQARKADLRSPVIVGYRRALLSYVMGKGLTVSADTGTDRLDEALDEHWERVKRVNRWDTLEDEIPHRTWRDGESFIRVFPHRSDGPPEDWQPRRKVGRQLERMGADLDRFRPRDLPPGVVFYRFVDPEHVRDPKGEVTDGLIVAEGDVQTVLGYMVSTDGTEVEAVPTSEMLHVKIGTDGNVRRGRSLYEPLLKRNRQYEDWLEYRILLNLARTAVYLVKKIERGSPAQVTSVRDDQATERRNPTNDRRGKMVKPGSTITASGIDYEFLSPNLDAADAQKDGRAILLNMAAATNLPEFMFTADANSMNFATSLAAEAPAMREFESWQDFYRPVYTWLWRQAMQAGAEFGGLPIQPEDAVQLEPHVSFEPIEVREELEHAQAQQIRFAAGILSRRSWQEDAGLDPDAEERRMSEERQMDFERTPPPADE